MDASNRYGFINARLRARIGLMRESHLIADMRKAGSLMDAVACTRDTGFAPLSKAYDETGDLQEMEFVLLQGEIASYQEVAGYLDGEPARFVMELLGKIEEDNLKNAIRLWYSSAIRMHSIRYRSEYLAKTKIVNDVNWAGIVNSTDWSGVVASVKGTFYEKILSAYTQDDIRKNGLFDLETAIDKGWYASLMESAVMLPKDDRAIALAILNTDFDLKNLLNMIRFGWYHQMDSSRLASTLFPYGAVYASKEVKTYIASPVDSRDPMPIVRRFYPSVAVELQGIVSESKDGNHGDQLMAKETLRLETFLSSQRQKEYHALLSKDPFTIGTALSYFYLYREMDTDIRAILNGKYYGYSEEEIRGLL